MGLHIGMIGAEKLLCPRDGQRLDFIDELATAVVAFARIAFRVLVGHHATLRFQHRFAHDVFRGDQLQVVFESLASLSESPRTRPGPLVREMT